MGQGHLLQLHQDLSGSWGHSPDSVTWDSPWDSGGPSPNRQGKQKAWTSGGMIKGHAVEATQKAHQGGLSVQAARTELELSRLSPAASAGEEAISTAH